MISPPLIYACTEVLDLTHNTNAELLRKWDQKEVAYAQMLRFIRVSSTNPTVAIVSKPGNHPSLLHPDLENMENGAPLLTDPRLSLPVQ